MLRLGAAVARRNPRLRRLTLRAGDRMVMACALGGPVPLFGDAELPVTVLVRGGPRVDRYVLYESDDPGAVDRHRFRPLDCPSTPLYGAGIRVFRTDNHDRDRAYFVRAYRGARWRDSEIMAAPIRSQPTHHVAGGLIARGPAPTFDWSAIDARRWVSFLIVRQAREEGGHPGGLLAAVYAWGSHWRYPDLAAAPFHYAPSPAADGAPPLPLPAGAEALYFAVRRDGWISAFDRVCLGEGRGG